jgi:acetyltransferase-like isoleucine patch superfamily enzyme
MTPDARLAALDAARDAEGFLGVDALIALAQSGVRVFDPYSALISKAVVFAGACRIEPCVCLATKHGGTISIGDGAEIAAGARAEAFGGRIVVGPSVDIGREGGFTLLAHDADLDIGARARLAGGGSVSAGCRIGAGAQIVGRIQARAVELAGGASYADPDPDRRGGVLKGFGVAHGVRVGLGEVIQAFGDFRTAPLRRQRDFHPEAPRSA